MVRTKNIFKAFAGIAVATLLGCSLSSSDPSLADLEKQKEERPLYI
ncbi:hypothetical protein LCGC14_1234610 [marine sediment metagenome]|uniref:Uncharacterized protein n=1 Tax=marine sediment metagenome TaxID=412755 RepID=A0A0F9LUV0_9ZZZZ